MKAAFRTIDLDNSGSIEFAEFKIAMDVLNNLLDNPLSETQIAALFQIIDKKNTGSILYNEFLESFHVVDTKVTTSSKVN
jgi:Ca2+-binding EF-hand superfamily protein